jgi:hypothetical protein
MFGEKSDERFYYFKKYGHYCNKARQMNVIPYDFREFKKVFSTNYEATIKEVVDSQINTQ